MSAPKPRKPRIQELAVTFEQAPDGNDADVCQEITVTTSDCGAGFYYVIKTERWAVDRPSEINDLIEQVKTMVGDKGK